MILMCLSFDANRSAKPVSLDSSSSTLDKFHIGHAPPRLAEIFCTHHAIACLTYITDGSSSDLCGHLVCDSVDKTNPLLAPAHIGRALQCRAFPQ